MAVTFKSNGHGGIVNGSRSSEEAMGMMLFGSSCPRVPLYLRFLVNPNLSILLPNHHHDC